VRALLVLVLAALSACHPSPPPPHADWIIHAQLVFLSADLKTERTPLDRAGFRLFFPYIAGDIYGAPTTGDFINPTLEADYHFTIDLNRSHPALLASLEPTDFSVAYLHIEPADARVARLAPMVLQADGIDPVGRTEWVDGDTRRTVMLLYFDRPARISGGKFAIRTAAAGYVWIGLDGDVYTVVPTPARLLLAVTASDLVPSAAAMSQNP
jgi:hypothetical protein